MSFQSAGKAEMSRFHGQKLVKNGKEGNTRVLTGSVELITTTREAEYP